MNKGFELLAPAGDYDSLVAAVQNGADAVYLGGKVFNARQNANNFDDEKLKDAVDYAHLRGVKVYLTLNTLLLNEEFKILTDFLLYSYEIGIDGYIIQDLGLAKFIKEVLPAANLHASTQMTISNVDGVLELERLGFKRVVLARELSLEEIKYICENSNIEIEVFIHGALCICYSGQCLMSSFIGGRSGNRGLCAQPCRLPYAISDKGKNIKGYLLSPKDNCTIDYIDKLIDCGVKSFKIEGRMKRPEYVGIVVSKYRKYIDYYLKNHGLNIDPKDYEELLQIYNRGGFTRNYLLNKKPEMSIQKPSNWGVYMGKVLEFDKGKKLAKVTLQTSLSLGDSIEFWTTEPFGMSVGEIIKDNSLISNADSKDTVYIKTTKDISVGTDIFKTSSVSLLERAKQSLKDEHVKIPIIGQFEAKLGNKIKFIISDNEGNKVHVEGNNEVQRAINKPSSRDRIIEQLSKLGNTPFIFTEVSLNCDDDINIPVSEINEIRRNAIEELSNKRTAGEKSSIDKIRIKENADKFLNRASVVRNNDTLLSISIMDVDAFKGIRGEFSRLYIPITEYMRNKDGTQKLIQEYKQNSDIYILLPRIMRGSISESVTYSLESLRHMIKGVVCTGLGQDKILSDEVKLHADFSYNIFNNLSADILKDEGMNSFTLSPELNIGQVKDILSKTNEDIEIIVYGNIPLMITEYCPTGEFYKHNCKKHNNNVELIDRLDNKFQVVSNCITCQSQILNSKTLFLGEDLFKVMNLKPNYMRLYFTTETKEEIIEAIKFHNDFMKYGKDVITDYKEYIDKIKENHTKGHYFRGVE